MSAKYHVCLYNESMSNLEKRATTPEKKREVIERLYQAWLKQPDQRLGQFLFNNLGDDFDHIFYIEDLDFIKEIEDL